MLALIPFGVSILISIFAFVWLRSELIVTDKRVYGKATFGRRVDLPVDSVTAISTGILKGVGVGTSSGKINFKLIKNQDEIHSVISNLLLERQKDNKGRTETQAVNFTNTDEIKKYKELLENGTITQEQFDTKKKQLLCLELVKGAEIEPLPFSIIYYIQKRTPHLIAMSFVLKIKLKSVSKISL